MASKVLYRGTGRRKRSVARVMMTPGTGKFVINGRKFNEYIPNAAVRLDVEQPLTLTENIKTFDIIVNVFGGGISGQAGAIRLGLSRALLTVNADLRPVLKAAGLLTRDSRVIERKKPGLKKARKSPQFSKR